jgi:hypothetical protein
MLLVCSQPLFNQDIVVVCTCGAVVISYPEFSDEPPPLVVVSGTSSDALDPSRRESSNSQAGGSTTSFRQRALTQ